MTKLGVVSSTSDLAEQGSASPRPQSGQGDSTLHSRKQAG